MTKTEFAEVEAYLRTCHVDNLIMELKAVHPKEHSDYVKAVCAEIYRRMDQQDIDPSNELPVIEAIRKWMR